MKKNSIESNTDEFPSIDANFMATSFIQDRSRKVVKSPLRYPGGKSRAVKKILEIFPNKLGTLVSPFFGGGSIELAAASQGTKVFGYDVFKPLVLFWQFLLDDPNELAKQVKKYLPLSRENFYELQAKLQRNEKLSKKQIAIIFFVLNRSSFSGTTLSGGMSPNHPRFTTSALERLEKFRVDGVSVCQSDFKKSIPKHKNDFLYCDPPYAISSLLYGKKGNCHKDFDHEGLAKILNRRDGWVLSYNDCDKIRDLYSGFEIQKIEWTYGMSSDTRSKEIIILSKDFR